MAATFQGWQRVHGRGWIAKFVCEHPEIDMRSFQVGGTVEIDGGKYECLGLEYAKGMTLAKNFGVLIQGEPKANMEKELDAEIRRNGDLMAALRMLTNQLASGRLTEDQQRKLSEYGKSELKRLGDTSQQ